MYNTAIHRFDDIVHLIREGFPMVRWALVRNGACAAHVALQLENLTDDNNAYLLFQTAPQPATSDAPALDNIADVAIPVGVAQVETATAAGTITAGVAQVETATVVGTIEAAGAGNASVTVTAVGMTGTPKAVSVAVANDDTASQVATKIRATLTADADVGHVTTGFFTVSGAGAEVILTAKVAAANDGTLNIAIDDDTSVGLTAAPTSANTTAGVAPGTGNAEVIVTAAGMTGSPITTAVAVVAGDTAATWAGKVRTALALNGNITSMFTVGGSGADIRLTRVVGADNDTTLNIALDNDTCTGITAAPASANTTAGTGHADWPDTAVKITETFGTFDDTFAALSDVFTGESDPSVVTLVPLGTKQIEFEVPVGHSFVQICVIPSLSPSGALGQRVKVRGMCTCPIDLVARDSGRTNTFR